MANVLTDLAADIYKAADNVSREQVGFIPAVTINADGSERVAVGGVVRSHFTRAATTVDNSPSMTIPEGTDQTVDNKTATITKSKSVQIPWTGEDVTHVRNGSGYETIYGDQIAQAMRTLTNLIEVDLAVEIYKNASRAYGTPGTTPFNTAGDYTDASETLRILKDNGSPQVGDYSLVINTAAGAKFIGKQAEANRQGTDSILRQGVLLDVAGFAIRESAAIQNHTKGTGTSYQSNNVAGYAIGATSIAIDTGTGTVLAGDTITFAGDTNKYVVTAGVSAPGTITIAAPGLRQTLADNIAMTIGNSYAANVALLRSSAELIMRPPAMPAGGDAADDAMMVQDPRSGLVFEIRTYRGFQKAMMTVGAAWGVKQWKQENAAILQG